MLRGQTTIKKKNNLKDTRKFWEVMFLYYLDCGWYRGGMDITSCTFGVLYYLKKKKSADKKTK